MCKPPACNSTPVREAGSARAAAAHVAQGQRSNRSRQRRGRRPGTALRLHRLHLVVPAEPWPIYIAHKGKEPRAPPLRARRRVPRPAMPDSGAQGRGRTCGRA